MPFEKACQHCAYWYHVGKEYYGDCRLNPPVILSPGSGPTPSTNAVGYWPATSADDWCGQFKRKPGINMAPDENQTET